jgi:2-succinyl-6-hydroxy-2,4-cyclohexadiene-1-carboxylate synthase
MMNCPHQPSDQSASARAARPPQSPSTLLLHGFTGTGADWAAIGATPRALAWDLPGHGGAADPSARGPDAFDAEVRRLLTVLPPSIERLVGYSLGGRIALSMLRLAPTRFRAVTVISAHPGLVDAAERTRRRDVDARWIALLRAAGIRAFVEAWETQGLFAGQQTRVAPPRLAAQRARRLAQRPEGLARSLECLGLGRMPPAREALAGFSGELQWIVGAEDTKFRALADQVRQWRPATRIAVLADCGHNPLLEQPEALAAALAGLG